MIFPTMFLGASFFVDVIKHQQFYYFYRLLPLMMNYLFYTFNRIAEEKSIFLSKGIM